VESGQLDALIVTPLDGATYRAAATPGVDDAAADRAVDRLALLIGMLVAIGALGGALATRFLPTLRLGRRGERT